MVTDDMSARTAVRGCVTERMKCFITSQVMVPALQEQAIIATCGSGTDAPPMRQISTRYFLPEDLFAGLNHVLFEHNGVVYLIQIIGQGRLLLTR